MRRVDRSLSCFLPLSTESLSPCPQKELVAIEHWEVGRYFTSFREDHYVPNAILKEAYPYD